MCRLLRFDQALRGLKVGAPVEFLGTEFGRVVSVNLDFDAHFGTWSGSRPMSPDGLPLMGRPHQYDNLVIAAGHGMFGLSLTPTSALAQSELVLDGRSSIDLSDFDPERFTIRRLVGSHAGSA